MEELNKEITRLRRINNAQQKEIDRLTEVVRVQNVAFYMFESVAKSVQKKAGQKPVAGVS